MKTDKKLSALISNHYEMPERVARLARMANLDLYFGPLGDEQMDDQWERDNYKGFSEALEEVSAWVEANVKDLWVDIGCECVMDSEPEAYQDDDGEWVKPYLEETWHVTAKESLKYLFGRELSQYL